MSLFEQLNCDLECARGIVAEATGQPFDVYRIDSESQLGWFREDNKIASGVVVYHEVTRNEKPPLESERRQGIIWYRVVADFSAFRLGDVFRLNNPCYSEGQMIVEGSKEYIGFCLASKPLKNRFGGRLHTTMKVYRPKQTADSRYAQPMGKGQADPLILVDGRFCLGGTDDTPCDIPVGLSAMRPYGDRAIDVPSMPRKMLYGAYTPPLFGFQFREGDRVVDENGNRYVVLVPYGQDSGAIGYQLCLEREVSSSGGSI